VRCVINPASRGAGIPDGGFFVAGQFQKGVAGPLPGQLPARGALEVKAVDADVRVVAESQQVRRYLEKYRQVLVTTYREFVLVGYDADGLPALLESQCFAAQGRRPIVSEMRGGGEGGKRLSWDRVFTLIEIEALDVDASRALDG